MQWHIIPKKLTDDVEITTSNNLHKLNRHKSSLCFLNGVNAATKRHSKQQKLSARRHAREHQFELRMRSTM